MQLDAKAIMEESNVQQAEESIKDLWENAPVPIAFYDTSPEHVCLRHNRAFLTLLTDDHRRSGTFTGTPLRASFPPDLAGTIAAIFDQVQATGHPFTAEEFPLPLRPDAPPRVFKGSLIPVRQDGAVHELMLMAFEITELVQARQAAEEARRRATLLADASHAFAEASLDYHVILHTVARQVANVFAGLCIARLAGEDEERLQPVAIAHPSPHIRAAAREWLTDAPEGPAEELCAQVLQSGQPALCADIQLEWGELSICGGMVVPLTTHGHRLGTLTVWCIDGQKRYGEADFALLQDLASRAALAVDNARMLQRVIDSEQRLRKTVRQLVVSDAQPASPLTTREQQVLRLMAEGCTNAEIAQRLRISHATVKHHVEHILTKLDAAGRTEAVAIASSFGLLRPNV